MDRRMNGQIDVACENITAYQYPVVGHKMHVEKASYEGEPISNQPY